MAAALDSLALLWALYIYRRRIVPAVRAAQHRWEALAEAIPEPALRDAALSALREKGSNAEATAVFAILAPRRRRVAVVRASVALQTAVDYLDSLGEQPTQDRLGDGLALHEALVDALAPGAVTSDWYRLHPHRDDGGYLAALVATCREEVGRLPAAGPVLPVAQRAARRCGEGQSHTHAAVEDGGQRLRAWADRLDGPTGYRWWEVAAGASSSVAAHALIAAAVDRRTDPNQAKAIDAAYFPAIGALTVLLDDLVDRDADRAAGEHNYMAHYTDAGEAADRLASIAGEARSALARLRHRHRHAAILAGVVGYYLSAPLFLDPTYRGEGTAERSVIRSRLLATVGPAARLVAGAQTARGPGKVPR